MPKNICIAGGNAEIVEKKSRFIADVVNIDSEEQALVFLEDIRKRYWDAKHHCYAYITADAKTLRFSDDKEPQGTAGKPMLEVLLHKEIVGICVVVTRYFGGILLGTGGLIRAYQGATLAGLDASKILEEKKGIRMKFRLNYQDYGKFQYICRKHQIIQEQPQYEEMIAIQVVAAVNNYSQFVHELMEDSAGTLQPIEEQAMVYVVDGENILEL